MRSICSLERGFRVAAQLVLDDPALLRADHDLLAARFAMPVRVLARLVDVEAVVRVLHQRDDEPARG